MGNYKETAKRIIQTTLATFGVRQRIRQNTPTSGRFMPRVYTASHCVKAEWKLNQISKT